MLGKEKTPGLNAYEEMMKGISEIAPGSDGLITLPYFAGERTPLNDPDARGMIVGLSLSHTKDICIARHWKELGIQLHSILTYSVKMVCL